MTVQGRTIETVEGSRVKNEKEGVSRKLEYQLDAGANHTMRNASEASHRVAPSHASIQNVRAQADKAGKARAAGDYASTAFVDMLFELRMHSMWFIPSASYCATT